MHKLKILSIVICCLISALPSEVRCMEDQITNANLPSSFKKLSRQSIDEIIERYNHNASSLSLYNEDIDHLTLSALITLFENKPIMDITLNSCRIDDVGADLLSRVRSLRRLFLENNNIADEGALALSKNKDINWINLTNNNIGNSGATALANKVIAVLYLNANNIGNEGANGLSQSSTIRELYILNNKISDKKVAEALIANKSFVTIGVNGDFCKSKGANTRFINTLLKKYNRDKFGTLIKQ